MGRPERVAGDGKPELLAGSLELEAHGELELAAGERGGGLAKARRTEGSDVAGEVGVVEDVEGGDAGGEDFCVVALVFGEAEVVVVEEVERGYSAALEGVAADAGGTGVAEAGVIVVVAGDFVVGRAGVEGGADAEGEPVIGVDVAEQIETLEAILSGAAPFVVWQVLVLGEGVDSAGIAIEARERVLTLACEPASGLAAERQVEGVEESAASGLDLLDLAEAEVGARVVGGEDGVWREDRGVGVAGAEALDLDLTAIGGGEGECLVDLALDAEAVLKGVGGADVRVESGEVGGKVLKFVPGGRGKVGF